MMTQQPIKLNLGSGDKLLEGYYNLDVVYGEGDNVYPITFSPRFQDMQSESWTADEIRASHVLEHFPHGQTQEILKHWVCKLKPGGVLKIAVPDFLKIAQAYAQDRTAPIEGYLMGGQIDEHDYHKALFDELGLRQMMEAAGLVDIQPWTSEIADCAALPISLNLMGTKPVMPQIQPPAPWPRPEAKTPEQVEGVPADGCRTVPGPVGLKIAAVMSVPRLCITNNIACIFQTIYKLGLPCRPGQGVFWHHVLTRQIEDRIAEGFDYLLAIDFDSWFLPGHVTRLAELLMANPQADAICAVQCQREAALPILGIHDENGYPAQAMPRSWFERPLTRLHIGHFGLTLFRAAAFTKLSRPWFRDEPNSEGTYREGRKDADVAFWGNFERSGCQLFQANEVNIGHLQEICTFPGLPVQNWKPVHVYLRDLNAGQIPAHCNPAYRIVNHDPINEKE